MCFVWFHCEAREPRGGRGGKAPCATPALCGRQPPRAPPGRLCWGGPRAATPSHTQQEHRALFAEHSTGGCVGSCFCPWCWWPRSSPPRGHPPGVSVPIAVPPSPRMSQGRCPASSPFSFWVPTERPGGRGCWSPSGAGGRAQRVPACLRPEVSARKALPERGALWGRLHRFFRGLCVRLPRADRQEAAGSALPGGSTQLSQPALALLKPSGGLSLSFSPAPRRLCPFCSWASEPGARAARSVPWFPPK